MKILFVLMLALAALFAFAQAEEKCDEACPYNYAPVCAKPLTGTGKALTFGNDCAVRVYSCETKTSSKAPTFPDDGKLRLYTMKFCPFGHRSQLIVEANKIPNHTVFVNTKDKPEWFIEKSPTAKVPTLEIPNKPEPLVESLIVSDYLVDYQPNSSLKSSDSYQRALDNILLDRYNGVISLFYAMLRGTAESTPENVTKFFNALEYYENQLKKRGTKFFNGSRPGFVDYMIWPWIERIDIVPNLIKGTFEWDENRFKNFLTWKKDMEQDPTVNTFWLSVEDHTTFITTFAAGNPNFYIQLISVVFIATLTNTSPAKKDSCQTVCTADYTPICAQIAQGKGADITFGNSCVLANYNCQHKDRAYTRKSDGECPGKAPVRL
ncbi:CLUMA_CG005718, isoform A [Clunio marinus]|uniref:CLUMA_CG005718, isoform A n=1 Tax=Clunio marinus TaxID=568069 RepID=A0A1J1HVR5_9DIPT|nr:CLUMA_CG005718, isoform A [Clunio marinus]